MSPDPSTTTVVVHASKTLLADAAAARLLTAILDAQTGGGSCDLVLTGGSMGSAILESVAASRIRDVVGWTRVSFWWGDERFLPTGDPERNETQARAALLDTLALDPGRVHAIAGPDRARDPDEAAARYAAELAEQAAPGQHVPEFDVLLLGVGPDAHIASLFPNHQAVDETRRSVAGVRGAPKPPPDRVSLTLPALRRARDVWFLVAGADKADAVALALSGAGPDQAPAGAVHGTRATRWLLDEEAAARLTG